jgi:hypothetical protein
LTTAADPFRTWPNRTCPPSMNPRIPIDDLGLGFAHRARRCPCAARKHRTQAGSHPGR